MYPDDKPTTPTTEQQPKALKDQHGPKNAKAEVLDSVSQTDMIEGIYQAVGKGIGSIQQQLDDHEYEEAGVLEKGVMILERSVAPRGSFRRGAIKTGFYLTVGWKVGRFTWKGLKAGYHAVRGNPVEAVQNGGEAFKALSE